MGGAGAIGAMGAVGGVGTVGAPGWSTGMGLAVLGAFDTMEFRPMVDISGELSVLLYRLSMPSVESVTFVPCPMVSSAEKSRRCLENF